MVVGLAPDLCHDLCRDLGAGLRGTGGAGMKEEIAIRDKEGRGSVTFRLLGAFRMTSAGRPHPPGPGQQQRLLVKLLEATSGEIRFDGRDLTQLRGAELKQMRREMQMIFQDPFSSVNPR